MPLHVVPPRMEAGAEEGPVILDQALAVADGCPEGLGRAPASRTAGEVRGWPVPQGADCRQRHGREGNGHGRTNMKRPNA